MKNITIGGYTVAELTKLQTAIKKDASKVIANAVAQAEASVTAIIAIAEEHGDEEITDFDTLLRAHAKNAEENLSLAELISGISGVEYYVSYDEEYREQDDTMSTRINAAFDDDYPDVLSGVMNKLDNMEHQSYLWNSSSIGC